MTDPAHLGPEDGSPEYREAILQAIRAAVSEGVANSERMSGRLVGALASAGLRIYPQAALARLREENATLTRALIRLRRDIGLLEGEQAVAIEVDKKIEQLQTARAERAADAALLREARETLENHTSHHTINCPCPDCATVARLDARLPKD